MYRHMESVQHLYVVVLLPVVNKAWFTLLLPLLYIHSPLLPQWQKQWYPKKLGPSEIVCSTAESYMQETMPNLHFDSRGIDFVFNGSPLTPTNPNCPFANPAST